MAKRMVVMLAATALFVAGLGFVKFTQFQTMAGQAAAFQPPPEAVTTIVAQPEQWPATLTAIGTAAAVQGVTVSADLAGTIERVAFDSGQAVRQGDILVALDTRQERAQLAAVQAERDLAQRTFDRMEGLLRDGVISRAEYDRATADHQSTEARVGEIRAAIDRKTIRAPFAGVLGLRQVNLGQYLSAGHPVVSLQALNPIYVNFGVPQQVAGQVHVGRDVHVTLPETATLPAVAGVDLVGRVTAIDSVVDEATRNIQVQATFTNAQAALRPGMFVQATLTVGASHSGITLPGSAINYAPYGNSVFVVSSLKNADGASYRGVTQKFVTVAGARGDQVEILSGVNAGDEVVTSGLFKLRNGAAVVINNKVRPANNRAPKPEDS